MKNKNDYLSEFEQEWNSDQESYVQTDEFELDDEFEQGDSEEFESDNDAETDDEFETDDEIEANEEFESDDEFETDDNGEFEISTDLEVNPKYTSKLQAVLGGNHESELEFDQELNTVLHEMEKDYFWGGLKKKFNKFKKSGIFSTLKKIANKTPLGDAIKQYTALARGDIKGMLKGLAGQALTTMVPGGAAAKQLLNLELPVSSSDPRKNAQVINKVAKNAFSNLVQQLVPINSPSQLTRIKHMGKSSFNRAWQQVNSRSIATRRITLRRGDKLIIKVI
jgi:hypothetical protein